ncbi:MAG: ASCH domain-containing protein [Akkermansiaceae bacterium]|nr:ASCH domain-containing protein [Akkermansiaceae bacterium]MDB4687962.1 ASCH domain-containing protein [Akkermansiaceae bacterium]
MRASRCLREKNYPIPQVGDIGIFLDGSREPACVGEVTEVEVKPFNEIDEAFAYDEGEGDRSYESWRREHIRFFTRSTQELGEEFDEDSLVVCERFRVLYK